ncbi:hypothetical protein [Catenulispora rubra]|uniref:hypothetical protein n=1 Tax=Catenulispora rubra TaxID=280293 RepID=UPI0018925A6F|nr:hypothetical protein [Catenulispora rubra]
MPIFPLGSGDDVRNKIDWEGGVWGALCWGLTAEDLPEQYREDWQSMAELYQELDERADAFYAGLPPGDEGEESALSAEAFRPAAP